MIYNLNQVIESEQEGIGYDPDSSPKAWEYYQKVLC